MQLPSTPLEQVAGQLSWAHTNINNNLDHIADDKLDWKPATEAKSVLEIITHATGTVHMFTHLITGTHQHELPPVTTRDEAKSAVTKVITAHLEAIKTLQPADLERVVSTPLGELPIGMIAGLPVVELINHHGQITYIQTMLGDGESHLSLT